MDNFSNIDEVEEAFDELFDSFGFTSETSGGQNVGDECVGTIADMIASDDAVNPDGTPWPDNSEPYRTRKIKKYGMDTTGYRTGQMLSIESLKGRPEITATEVNMTYGTGDPPTRSSTGMGFDPKTDGAVTDREKADYFRRIGEFYALNEERSQAVVDVIAEAFGKMAEDKFGGGTP